MTSKISSILIDLRQEITRSCDELRQDIRELTLKVEVVEQAQQAQGA